MKYEDAVAQAEAEGITIYEKWCKNCLHVYHCEGNIGFDVPEKTQYIMKDVLGRLTDNPNKKRNMKRPCACTSDGELCPYAGNRVWKRVVVK